MGNTNASGKPKKIKNNRAGLSDDSKLYEDMEERRGSAPQTAHIIRIAGWGCKATSLEDRDTSWFSRVYGNNIILKEYCPRNRLTTVEVITRCILRQQQPKRFRTFLKTLVLKIYSSLLNPAVDVVVASGHSHGGFLATLAVLWICNPSKMPMFSNEDIDLPVGVFEAHLHKLHLITFGSIYTVHSSLLPGVASVHQYLYAKDIALLCMKAPRRPLAKWKLPKADSEPLMSHFNTHFHTIAMAYQPANENGVTFIMPLKSDVQHPEHGEAFIETNKKVRDFSHNLYYDYAFVWALLLNIGFVDRIPVEARASSASSVNQG